MFYVVADVLKGDIYSSPGGTFVGEMKIPENVKLLDGTLKKYMQTEASNQGFRAVQVWYDPNSFDIE